MYRHDFSVIYSSWKKYLHETLRVQIQPHFNQNPQDRPRPNVQISSKTYTSWPWSCDIWQEVKPIVSKTSHLCTTPTKQGSLKNAFECVFVVSNVVIAVSFCSGPRVTFLDHPTSTHPSCFQSYQSFAVILLCMVVTLIFCVLTVIRMST